MKRGVFVGTVVGMAAGVASALAFGPVSPTASRPAPAVAAPASTTASPPAVAAPASTPAKSTLEARQAPVPLVLKTRTPVVALPDFDSAAAASAPAAEAKANEGDGGAAKAAVEADGYKSVKVLRKGANGLWYAEALRGKTKVLLTVDSQGNVAAE